MSQPAVNDVVVTRVQGTAYHESGDLVAAEEPLEIRVIYGKEDQRRQQSISVTMRTPGNDDELAIGFLFTEGIIQSIEQVDQTFSFSCNEAKDNTITVALKEDVSIDLKKLERHFYATSSCGVCGKSSIEAVRTVVQHKTESGILEVTADFLYRLPAILRAQQDIFQSTGGLHASALFDLEGNLVLLREDVGRHNALDKLIGRCLLNTKTPLNQHLLLLSGRASFELIQKAAAGGIKIVAAIGAPSSLAVALAKDCDITLLGFLNYQRFNIYSGKERVIV